MASSTPSPSVTSSPPSYDDIRQQAGPLPSKRGELGFIEGVHSQHPVNNQDAVALPARHPADRDAPPTPGPSSGPSGSDANAPPVDIAELAAGGAVPPSTTSNKPGKYFKNVPLLGGILLTTFLLFIFQLAIIAACIIAWVFTSNKLISLGSDVPGGKASTIFIHAVFIFVLIGQLIFLERRVYRMRAERYASLHPGEMLPRYRDRTQEGGDLSFAYAPWNRPPLPTYAAALSQSGHGTGDVDDHLIAIPPPPAYGNTRGSTMVLQGFLTDELRAQRPVSVQTVTPGDLERGEGGGRKSLDGGDGETATSTETRERRREQTLARLQNSGPTTVVPAAGSN